MSNGGRDEILEQRRSVDAVVVHGDDALVRITVDQCGEDLGRRSPVGALHDLYDLELLEFFRDGVLDLFAATVLGQMKQDLSWGHGLKQQALECRQQERQPARNRRESNDEIRTLCRGSSGIEVP
ncbi:MAG TPA: hypothetical protein DCG16_02490 [Gemmatimonadetes bacterium]|nr:hypothetical protein [Gemmatimonadota bacterium]